MMKTKVLLTSGVSLFLFCTAISTSFAQAGDYVTKSQINAANGVAGLNANQQVTADINSNEQVINRIILKEQPYKDDFTDPSESNFFRFLSKTSFIDLFYNLEERKDPWGKQLDANTFYFSNHYGGNNYQFVGNVAATGIISAPSVRNGQEPINPYKHIKENDEASIIKLTNDSSDKDPFVRRNTLMIGGESRASYAGIKANCQNTGSGDLGGSCYQFIDMSGEQGTHRSGAGFTDGANMDIRSSDNSPVDVIGGNLKVENLDGSYVIKGNDYPIAENVSSGATTFKIIGTFGCGLVGKQGSELTGCKMTGINVLDGNGNKVSGGVWVTPGEYIPPVNDTNNQTDGTTLVNLPIGYKIATALTKSDVVNIIFYSADGVAYAVENTVNSVRIYPALSQGEKNLIHERMAIWSNIANGMFDEEGKGIDNKSNVDMPDYYYAYENSINDSNPHFTEISLATQANTRDAQIGWRKISIDPGSSTPVGFAPGSNENDKYDYQIKYKNLTTNNEVYNHNFHRYRQPTLFLGLSQKNFNIYTLQTYDKNPDSITREFDNEWDFWIHSHRDYEVSTRGITLTWGMNDKQYQHKFAIGSYMLSLNGGGFMPDGIRINGVYDKGRIITSDGGLNIFKHSFVDSKALDAQDKYVMINTLGQAKTDQGSYQLLTYMSNDTNTNNKNYSMHLGLTKRYSASATDFTNLDFNQSPDCSIDNPEMAVGGPCVVSGQILFSPVGYEGGVGLGVGRGKDTKIGLVVDQYGRNHFKDSLFVDPSKVVFFSNSDNPNAVYLMLDGTYTDADQKAGKKDTRGDIYVGTQIDGGANIRGVRGYYGKSFTVGNDDSKPFLRLSNDNTFFNVLPKFNSGISIAPSQFLYFQNSKSSYAAYLYADENGDMNLGTQVGSGANVRGVRGYYGASVTVSEQVSASKFHGQLSTPSSSSEACSAGDFKDDANYHYVCVSTNKWKRAALSDF